jgi:hypothetical protein
MASESPKDRAAEPLTERRDSADVPDSRPTHVDDPAFHVELDGTSEPFPPTPHSALSPSPGVSSEPMTQRRQARTSVSRRTGEDTLLSLPAPADAEEPAEQDPYIAELERRIVQLEARVRVLEAAGTVGKRWLAWIAFMVTLAAIWHIVRQSR